MSDKKQNSAKSDATAKSVNRRRGRRPELELPEEVQHVFDAAVKEAAGKPLSMEPDSPLARVIGAFVEHALKEEMNEHLGYDHHQRDRSADQQPSDPASARRSTTRNGYQQKLLKTSMGSTSVEVPRDRAGSFEPVILPKHASMSSEIEARVISMYASGLSTRDIAEQVRSLYHFSASENFVSRIVERIEPELIAWRNRPLESVYAIVYLDALYVKIRHPNGVAATACYIVSGYCESGRHEVLGLWIAPSDRGGSESASFWQTVLLELEQRGVKDILIIASDGLTGLEQAVSATYPRSEHIPCVVHLMRNSMALVGHKYKHDVAASLKQIYQAPTLDAAHQALEALSHEYADRYPLIVRQWQQGMPRLAVLWQYPQALRQMVYTTNPQENINRQVRKVTKTRGQFPSIDSALRLLSLALIDIDRRNAKPNRTRTDWQNILQHLRIRFPDRLPLHWGTR